jgi:hypothetical protein
VTVYQLITIAIVLLNVIAIPIVRNIYTKIDEANNSAAEAIKSLQSYKLHVSETYVSQGQLDKHMDRIDKSLDEIKLMIGKLAK